MITLGPLPREPLGSAIKSWIRVLWRARRDLALMISGLFMVVCFAFTIWDAVTPASWPRPIEVTTSVACLAAIGMAAWLVVAVGRLTDARKPSDRSHTTIS